MMKEEKKVNMMMGTATTIREGRNKKLKIFLKKPKKICTEATHRIETLLTPENI